MLPFTIRVNNPRYCKRRLQTLQKYILLLLLGPFKACPNICRGKYEVPPVLTHFTTRADALFMHGLKIKSREHNGSTQNSPQTRHRVGLPALKSKLVACVQGWQIGAFSKCWIMRGSNIIAAVKCQLLREVVASIIRGQIDI